MRQLLLLLCLTVLATAAFAALPPLRLDISLNKPGLLHYCDPDEHGNIVPGLDISLDSYTDVTPFEAAGFSCHPSAYPGWSCCNLTQSFGPVTSALAIAVAVCLISVVLLPAACANDRIHSWANDPYKRLSSSKPLRVIAAKLRYPVAYASIAQQLIERCL